MTIDNKVQIFTTLVHNIFFLSLFLLKLQFIFLAKSIFFDVPRRMFVNKAQVFYLFNSCLQFVIFSAFLVKL
jgi:hypothetical protein